MINNVGVNQIPLSNPKSPLEQALNELDKHIGLLDYSLNDLHEQLAPVLGQISPNKGANPSPPPSGSSAVMERVYQITRRIELMHETAIIVRGRLEV